MTCCRMKLLYMKVLYIIQDKVQFQLKMSPKSLHLSRKMQTSCPLNKNARENPVRGSSTVKERKFTLAIGASDKKNNISLSLLQSHTSLYQAVTTNVKNQRLILAKNKTNYVTILYT